MGGRQRRRRQWSTSAAAAGSLFSSFSVLAAELCSAAHLNSDSASAATSLVIGLQLSRAFLSADPKQSTAFAVALLF